MSHVSGFRKGQKVYFGRSRGEQTLGEIVKINPKNARVKQLEERGVNRVRPAGTIWTVPYSLLRDAGSARADTIINAFASAGRNLTKSPVDTGDGTTMTFAPKEPLTYNPFSDDNTILEAILGVYSDLSPENLHADGERPITQVRRLYAELQRKLKHLQLALGREVDEGEIYEWSNQRRKFQQEREHRKQTTA